MTKERPDSSAGQERDREIATIRDRLARLEFEKSELEASLARLLAIPEVNNNLSAISRASVTNASSPAAKITLFRSLFRGREDVFPKRWENAKTNKAGYAPACANEWAPRICGKPKVKCSDCAHRAFLPVTDEVIDGLCAGAIPSASIPCWRTRPAGSLPPISTKRRGATMPRLFLRHARRAASRRHSSAPVPGGEGTCGYSLPSRFRCLLRGGWGRISSPRRWRSSQCLDRRIPDKQTLIDEIAAWEQERNTNHTKANWHFTIPKARVKLSICTLRSD